jgi:plasmid maintenance system antidote protein VapI
LQEAFERRIAKNSRYSLRAFARSLGISPSRLCEILKGKQGLSVAWAEKIATRLKFEKEKKRQFCDLVEAEHSRSEARRRLAKQRLEARSERCASEQLDSSLLVSFSADDLSRASEAIERFRNSFSGAFNRPEKEKESVYCLAVQFFKTENPTDETESELES